MRVDAWWRTKTSELVLLPGTAMALEIPMVPMPNLTCVNQTI